MSEFDDLEIWAFYNYVLIFFANGLYRTKYFELPSDLEKGEFIGTSVAIKKFLPNLAGKGDYDHSFRRHSRREV